MFIFIPLVISFLALFAVFTIVFRKRVFIRKLDALDFKNGAGFWISMFPEMTASLSQLRKGQYKDYLLAEIEKFLRRLKIVSLKIENIVSHWLEKFPKTKGILSHQEILENQVTLTTNEPNGLIQGVNLWKQLEQQLIMNIAKSPKNAELYKKLGVLYMKQRVWSDAHQALKQAVELDPADLEVQARFEKVSQKLEPLKEN